MFIRDGGFPGGGHGNPLWYLCLENPHGQRSLAGYSPQGRKELDMTEGLYTHILDKLANYGETLSNKYLKQTI